eukprot:CAMPEP_0197608804 /NCGR_PEP_ID=MMETSP1326-20131121/49890_1 /TAXON_ID=1155430 /ORGANISM="Genus nov. species nov., Strain RCC2288" /LENGTH=54 /DNA_ID=CAMNT_0043177077 /DNA_START=102 /DNA_END=263 /DNA_ORIENTATION=-
MAKGLGAVSHSRRSHSDSATRPWPVMKISSTLGDGQSGATAKSVPREPEGKDVM